MFFGTTPPMVHFVFYGVMVMVPFVIYPKQIVIYQIIGMENIF